MEASWEEVRITTKKIFIQKMAWMELMKEIKGWNPNRNFKLLEERSTRIKEDQEAIQAIEVSQHMEEASHIQVPQYMEEEVLSSTQQYSSSKP
ncbi:hypothetical protein O181_006920 [Austropuccinia psidii MF-1]|uniref:Uncharacterized protein n=1 Tax=Austropuccinia psidii MF-1 TaxID=1389203 RepID=A0A9Q3BLX5_9BASI|nr:hypothetical protein [Austropuccinia psidii MF-1]